MHKIRMSSGQCLPEAQFTVSQQHPLALTQHGRRWRNTQGLPLAVIQYGRGALRVLLEGQYHDAQPPWPNHLPKTHLKHYIRNWSLAGGFGSRETSSIAGGQQATGAGGASLGQWFSCWNCRIAWMACKTKQASPSEFQILLYTCRGSVTILRRLKYTSKFFAESAKELHFCQQVREHPS